MWGIIAEDLAEESDRVILGEGDGMKIVYRLSENSRRLVAFPQERAKESLIAAGSVATVVAPFIRATGCHLLGTAVIARTTYGTSTSSTAASGRPRRA